MPNVVTITSSEGVVVVSHRLGDRERFENGRDVIEPGKSRHFIVDDGQSLAIDHYEPPEAPAEEPAAEGDAA